MSKAPDAFRTISEVSEILETPPHVLRFWETKFTQLKPVKRAGGRRYYRPSDLELLGGIKRLLHDDGMTIRGVQKMLREKGVKHVAAHSPPLEIDLEAEASEAQPAPAVAPPAQETDAPDAAPVSKMHEAADDRSDAESPPMPERQAKEEAEPAPPEETQTPSLPFDAGPDHPPAAPPASDDAAPGETPDVEADAEALAARIRALSEGDDAAAAAPAEQDAPPPASESGAFRDPVTKEPAHEGGESAEPRSPDVQHQARHQAEADTAAQLATVPPPSEGDDDARPGIATLLRRLNGPLPAGRAQALRPLAARMDALNTRLAEADDAATG